MSGDAVPSSMPSAASGSDHVGSRTSLQLLVDRQFGTVFWAKFFNLVAVWAFTVITISVAYGLTSSTVWTGIVGAAFLAPQLLLTLLSGRLSDTHGEQRMIALGGALSGAAALLLAALWRAAPETEGALQALVILTFVGGCGMAMSSPAQQSIVTRIVLPGELSAAVSLNFLPTATARAMGPAGGAALLVTLGPSGSMLVVGGILGATALAVRLAHLPLHEIAAAADVRVVAALRYVATQRILGASLLAVAAVGAGSEPVITLAPALAASLHRPEAAGVLLAAFGLGGALGVALHSVARRRLPSYAEAGAAMGGLAVAIASIGIVTSFVHVLLVLVAAGACMVVAITATSVAVQQHSSREYLGRVMAMWVLAFAGIRPLAAPAIGLVADRYSIRTALWCTAAMLIMCGIAYMVVARRTSPRADS